MSFEIIREIFLQAFRLDAREESSGYLNIALMIWLAAWIVMLLECFIKIFVKMRAVSLLSNVILHLAIFS